MTVPFDVTVRLMQALTALAMLVVGLEWQAMHRRGVLVSVWDARVLHPWWRWRHPLMRDHITRVVPLVQITLATTLLLAAMLDDRRDVMGAVSSAGLALTLWHTAVRVRGTMNGGSDGMLFVVLLALTIATAPAPEAAQRGAILFVAAQVLLSYLRAGWVKARERDWWTGDALRAFFAIPAYRVPAWVPRGSVALRLLSIGVIGFELLAPLAFWHPRAAVMYTAVAWCFHLATAVLFGLNRFLLAWSAALPSLWFAAHVLRGTG